MSKKTVVKKKKTVLKLSAKLLINMFFIAILTMGSIYLFVIASNINAENEKILLEYEEFSDIKYEVSLKDNKYYPTKVVGMNQQYPNALINKIKLTFYYKFNTSENSNMEYRYFANAKVIAKNKSSNQARPSKESNSVLIEKNFPLLNEEKDKTNNVKEFSVTKNFTIDYDKYNKFITEFKNDYNLSLDSYIKVLFYVEVKDTYNNKVVKTFKNMEVNIPLITNPVEITLNKGNDKKEVIKNTEAYVESSLPFTVFAVIMGLVALFLLLQDIRMVLRSERKQNKYLDELHKIMSQNSEVIVTVKNKINLKNHNIIEVNSIEELIDVQNELRVPITYYEVITNYEGLFIIVNGNEAWKYVLKIGEDELN